ncbi:MAG: hypothetical protein A3E51_04175 [Burkholderiales bacterium RIFCSPHIGHO2_12_FULL_67_38]|nr:MAG: hypothetical protein A3I64_08445 [Burkholderiales bacterium RIFCSPLOWO2_02_FULL_67_64]OGB38148.1 MAG: hypothetical protein A3E51_04175 [Burkholderiales bacterium RIFCSPHIGHO2_12_FULL_67_38]
MCLPQRQAVFTRELPRCVAVRNDLDRLWLTGQTELSLAHGSKYLLHIAVIEPGDEIAGVVTAEGFAPVLGAVVALTENAGTGLQVGADIERLGIGGQAVFGEVVTVDLCNANGEVVAFPFELLHCGERFFQTARLPGQIATDHTDGKGIARGFHVHDVLNHLFGNGEILAVLHIHESQQVVPKRYGRDKRARRTSWSGTDMLAIPP